MGSTGCLVHCLCRSYHETQFMMTRFPCITADPVIVVNLQGFFSENSDPSFWSTSTFSDLFPQFLWFVHCQSAWWPEEWWKKTWVGGNSTISLHPIAILWHKLTMLLMKPAVPGDLSQFWAIPRCLKGAMPHLRVAHAWFSASAEGQMSYGTPIAGSSVRVGKYM